MEEDLLVIHSKSERGFWSNADGWVFRAADASVYTRDEASAGHLPMTADNDAEWVVIEYAD